MMKKVLNIFLFLIVFGLFIGGNLYKGTISTGKNIFSIENILSVGLVFLIGVPLLYYFQNRKKNKKKPRSPGSAGCG